MAYNNNYNNRGPHPANQGYNNGRNFNNGRRQKKHSGAKEGIQRRGKNEGKLYISAWIYRKNMGLVKIIGFENAKSVHSESERGNKFVTIMFECIWQDSGQKRLILGNYNMTSGKVFLDDLGWVISTKARNGGYCGPINN